MEATINDDMKGKSVKLITPESSHMGIESGAIGKVIAVQIGGKGLLVKYVGFKTPRHTDITNVKVWLLDKWMTKK